MFKSKWFTLSIQAVICGIVVGLILLVGMHFLPMAANAATTDAIYIKKLVIVDDSGNNRIVLSTKDDASTIMANDKNGVCRFMVDINQFGPILTLFDKHFNKQLSLSAIDIGLTSSEIRLWDTNGKTRAFFSLEGKDSFLVLSDNLSPRLIATANENTSFIAIRDKNGKVIWRAP